MKSGLQISQDWLVNHTVSLGAKSISQKWLNFSCIYVFPQKIIKYFHHECYQDELKKIASNRRGTYFYPAENSGRGEEHFSRGGSRHYVSKPVDEHATPLLTSGHAAIPIRRIRYSLANDHIGFCVLPSSKNLSDDSCKLNKL